MMFKWLNPLWVIENFLTCYGGGDSGGGGSSTQTSYSTNLPEYAQPYYNELLRQTGNNVFTTDSAGNVTGIKPYTQYTGERVAGFSPTQQAIQSDIFSMQSPTGFDQGSAGLNATQQAAMAGMESGLGQALGYVPQQVQNKAFTDLTNTERQAYMSPYQSAVTDIAVQEAQREADRQRSQSALGAIGRGTFGGARDTLNQAMADSNSIYNIGKIKAQGQQDAYTQALNQFNTDQSRGLTAQQLEQQGQQYAAGLGKDLYTSGMSGMLDASKGLGALASSQQQADIDRLTAQSATAKEQQQLAQNVLDAQYQQAMEQRDWNQKQLQFYSDILRGNAAALGTNQVQYTAAPSVTSQIAGLGLAGLGLTKALS